MAWVPGNNIKVVKVGGTRFSDSVLSTGIYTDSS